MPTNLPHVVRVAASGTFNAERWVNVYHFMKRDLTEATSVNILSLLNLLGAAPVAPKGLGQLISAQDTGMQLDTIHGINLDTATPAEATLSVNRSGANAGTDAPPMLSTVLRWKTDIATRNFRGRTYLTGNWLGAIDSDSDRWSSAYYAGVVGLAAAFVAAWSAETTWAFIILSEKLRQQNAADCVEEVVTSSVNPLICVQRRRRQR